MSMNTANMLRRLFSEFLGTALLVIGGVGTAVLAPQAGELGIAVAFGLTLLVLAYALGPISGAHVNPAVTLGMVLSGRLRYLDGLGYVVAQLLGGIAGASVVYAIASNKAGYSLGHDGLGANGYGAASSGGYNGGAAFIAEVMLTGLLVFVVIAVTATATTAIVAGIPIGLALLVDHLVAIPIDGTSVNPARSLGPALFVGGSALSQLWVFIVAPLLGAVIAAGLHRFMVLTPLLARPEGRNDDPTADPGLLDTRGSSTAGSLPLPG